MDFGASDIRRALSDPAYWELVNSNADATRRMFTDWVEKVLVRDRQVEAVLLKLEGCGAVSSLGLS